MREFSQEKIAELEATAARLRFHIVDMVYKAQSGHCGGSLSSADIVTALYFGIMKNDPADPDMADRDRFILSKGHACPVQYGALAMRGYFPIEELGTLRRLHSRLQGHPVAGKLPGIEVTSGSLGVGFCEAVGIALDGKLRKASWRVWTLLGDGELNEGAVWEAAQAGSKFGLDNLTAIVDWNGLQNDGFCEDIMPAGSIAGKFKAFGWETFEIDGHDMAAVVSALRKAAEVKGRPTCIVARTVKGKGVSFMENKRDWHGKAPNEAQHAQAVAELAGGRK
ncbi:MAG: transketolase [Spirochaetae bacterium HGW-Spirochaetae-9]|nr:MAG: transketolase [Spirochaetae bacterium HGW-Spirochaetae-9]